MKSLLLNIDFSNVLDILKQCYEPKNLQQFQLLYNHLKILLPNENKDGMVIYIQAFYDVDGENVYLPDYNEFELKFCNETVCFDVCGKNNQNEGVYSIASCSHADFLGYFVEEETVKRFTCESIIAHLLWEITFYGFDDRIS